MTHLLSFLLFIHFFHTEYPLLIKTSLLRTYVFFLLFIFIYGGLQGYYEKIIYVIPQHVLEPSSFPVCNLGTAEVVFAHNLVANTCIAKVVSSLTMFVPSLSSALSLWVVAVPTKWGLLPLIYRRLTLPFYLQGSPCNRRISPLLPTNRETPQSEVDH